MIRNEQPEAHFAIIVAGGSGSRMQTNVPKQFLVLRNKPILQHTIEQFMAVDGIHIILVLPNRDLTTWQTLCQQYNFHPDIQIIIGGDTRFQSVRNGLQAITAEHGFVTVHDGVRPFITPNIIQNGFDVATQTGSAVTCVPLKDSVRVINPDGSNTSVDRSLYRLIQTPQTFSLVNFRQAFQQEEQPFFTDCASVMEHAGFPITLIDGDYENIKITTPDDLRYR